MLTKTLVHFVFAFDNSNPLNSSVFGPHSPQIRGFRNFELQKCCWISLKLAKKPNTAAALSNETSHKKFRSRETVRTTSEVLTASCLAQFQKSVKNVELSAVVFFFSCFEKTC